MDFEYDSASGRCRCSAPRQTAHYRGYTISAIVEEGPENPFKEWDAEPPLIVYNGSGLTSYGLDHDSPPELTRAEIKANTHGIMSQLGQSWECFRAIPKLTREEIKANAWEIARLIGPNPDQAPIWGPDESPYQYAVRFNAWKIGPVTLLRALGPYRRNAATSVEAVNAGLAERFDAMNTGPDRKRFFAVLYAIKNRKPTLLSALGDYRRDSTSGVDAVNTALAEHMAGLSSADTLEFLKKVWQWKGVKAICVARNGYVQSAWSHVLAVATPEWVNTVGAPPETHEAQLNAAADLYAAWAYGDVYGWVVESPDGDEIEACWGYYGSNHERSGLAEAAREAIDSHIEQMNMEAQRQRQRRFEQIKAWIRNRVPLSHRAPAFG